MSHRAPVCAHPASPKWVQEGGDAAPSLEMEMDFLHHYHRSVQKAQSPCKLSLKDSKKRESVCALVCAHTSLRCWD